MTTLRIAVRRFDGFERAIRQQWASYTASSGSTSDLEIVMLDLNPLTEALFTSGGLRDGTWDIAFVVTDWIAEAVANGDLLDLAPFIAQNPPPDYPAGWVPVLTRFQQFGEAIYGLPYHDGPECLIYRTDLFADPTEQTIFADRFGYPLAVPTTWAQYRDIAVHFTRPDGGLSGTIFAAYPDGHNSVYDFCLQLWSRGGELTDTSGAVTIATPEAIAALTWYREMVADRTVTPPGQEAVDSVRSGEHFANGEIAMMVNWFGFAAYCEQPDAAVKGKVGIAPIPSDPGIPPASLIVYWVLAIGSGSRHADEAYAFICHCLTPACDRITTFEGGIGCRRSTWTDPEVNTRIPFYHRLADLHEGTRELPRSRSFPALVHIIDRAVQEAITTSEPTAAILARAQAAAASIDLEA